MNHRLPIHAATGTWTAVLIMMACSGVVMTAAGLRVAAVSNVSIVSVAAVIGVPQLGSLFTDGFYRDFLDPIVAGVVASVVLALVFDAAIVLLARALTPWQRTRVGS